ncbi:MAG: AIR synthase-related protein [Actinomycetota bacterium]|nr:AIR synthase-related protein [Actinomycetota bacterium]
MSSAYERAGVDYATLDAAKRRALASALATTPFAAARGARLEDSSRGEPAVVVEVAGVTLGFVLECLGTKSTIAREYEALTGADRFEAIGYDTVAAVVNDCCCVGALPFVVNAYFATGSAAWYEGTRHESLVAGFRRGCEDSGAAWGGGESPTLAGLVAADAIDLAGSAVGIVPEGTAPLLGAALAPGDEIVLVASSGLHANGASLARAVATGLPDGLLTPLPSGRLLGEALLDASVVYVALVEGALRAGIGLHYVSHVTGHGMRKLMRAERELTYRVTRLPPVPEVLAFLASRAGLSPRESYGTVNMGAGLACFVAPGAGEPLVKVAEALGYSAAVSGVVEEGPRRVVLEPVGVEYGSSELDLR